MTGWRLTADPEQPRDDRWRSLPAPLMAHVSGPEKYLPHAALIDAINTALALGQPLLVTGEPGCGKTELGDFVAWKLGLGRAIRFSTKTDMQARDLFYTFDTVARFHAAQMAARQDEPRVSIDALNSSNITVSAKPLSAPANRDDTMTCCRPASCTPSSGDRWC